MIYNSAICKNLEIFKQVRCGPRVFHVYLFIVGQLTWLTFTFTFVYAYIYVVVKFDSFHLLLCPVTLPGSLIVLTDNL